MWRNFPPRKAGSNQGVKRSEPVDNEIGAESGPLFDAAHWEPLNPLEPPLLADNGDEMEWPDREQPVGPSLPIILLSTASGIGAGILALYITYNLLHLPIEWSVAAAVFCLSSAVGSTGALLSTVTGSRAGVMNIAFSCGLIVVTLLFFALCTFVGALAATFILTL